jgi:RecA-family ATPase
MTWDHPSWGEAAAEYHRDRERKTGLTGSVHWSRASWEEESAPEQEPPPLTLEEWLDRDLPEPDFLLGQLLSTTSRVIINAPTGIGKTMFLMGMFMGMSAGLGFLRWPSVRQARTLFIDGEMSRRLLKQRLAEEAKRLGVCPENMHVLSREDIETFPPLSTRAGQMIVERVIEHLGGIDVVGFDNVMSLIGGDMGLA